MLPSWSVLNEDSIAKQWQERSSDWIQLEIFGAQGISLSLCQAIAVRADQPLNCDDRIASMFAGSTVEIVRNQRNLSTRVIPISSIFIDRYFMK